MSSMPPVSCSPAATTNKPAIMSIGLAANPATASWNETTPKIMSMTSPPAIMRSGPIRFLLTSAMITTKIVTNVIQACGVIA